MVRMPLGSRRLGPELCARRIRDPEVSTRLSVRAARTLQEFMGHRDLTTTQIYADYSSGAREVQLVNDAFATKLMPN